MRRYAPVSRPEHLDSEHAGVPGEGLPDHRAASPDPPRQRERADRALEVRHRGPGGGTGDHHLDARALGTHQRGGRPEQDFYYTSLIPAIKANPALQNDGTILLVLDVLARQVGILGTFSDWAATPAFYANRMSLAGRTGGRPRGVRRPGSDRRAVRVRHSRQGGRAALTSVKAQRSLGPASEQVWPSRVAFARPVRAWWSVLLQLRAVRPPSTAMA
jgi:hypothetical protein